MPRACRLSATDIEPLCGWAGSARWVLPVSYQQKNAYRKLRIIPVRRVHGLCDLGCKLNPVLYAAGEREERKENLDYARGPGQKISFNRSTVVRVEIYQVLNMFECML